MKYIFTTLMVMLFTSNAYAHNTDSFYVIPTGRVIHQEVCNGTPIDNGVFELNISSSYEYLYEGDVFSSTTGHLVLITGNTHGSVRYDSGSKFLVAPSVLPNPPVGVKGPYYILDNNGDYAFAKFL